MKMHQLLLIILLQATLLSIHFPCFYSRDSKIIYYAAIAPNCSDVPFQCGSLAYIAYPFWGGSRPESCGRQGFEIVCSELSIPILKISSLSYRVQRINFNTSTLTIAREDLLNAKCPKVLHNTTIDPGLFGYLANDKNLTLYFDCTSIDQKALQNRFTCDGDDSNTTNVFMIGNAPSGSRFGITCSKNIFVPVNREDAESLKEPSPSSINNFWAAIDAGFSITWQKDENQHRAPYCNRNVYGSCIGPNSKINKSLSCPYANHCGSYRRCNGNYTNHRGVLEITTNLRGCSDVSPGPAPKSEDNNTRTTNGIPPVQSPGYPVESGDSPYPQPRPVPGPGPKVGSNQGYLLAPPGIFIVDPRNSSHPVGIILGAVLGIINIVIASITIYCYCKRRRLQRCSNQGSNQDLEHILGQHGSLAPKRYKYSEIKKITKYFSDKLGEGGFGTVYKGILPDGCLVAVKVLIETNSNGEEFINEVASISRTSHVNIVNLLGFCYDKNKRALIYEFMQNKSLDKFIYSNAERHLDLEKLYEIALGVAKGLEYLHIGCNTRIVHFDIKPQNILLDEDFCPKISDFGLAKLCKKKQSILSMLGARGTIGYIAPEIFSRNFGGVSHKSDVYSYGMMVLEMVGARNIVETEVIQTSENYFPDKIYEEVILDVSKKLEDFKIEEEDDATRKMFLVGFWCIQTTPSDRPSMSKVVEMLEGNLQSIQIPPKPFLFSPRLIGQELSPSFSTYVETENSAEEFS